MNEILLFTDGSADADSGIGYGSCLLVTDKELSPEAYKNQVKVHRFENTSSTRLELETLLWALKTIPPEVTKIKVYTDSGNITGLLSRRKRLEQNDYKSKNNRYLSNRDLYKAFFQTIDSRQCEFIKVKGHQPARQKDAVHRYFTIVDKASRRALRKELD